MISLEKRNVKINNINLVARMCHCTAEASILEKFKKK
jgi:hypothetical protein